MIILAFLLLSGHDYLTVCLWLLVYGILVPSVMVFMVPGIHGIPGHGILDSWYTRAGDP